jgi:hypothetical protein
MVATHRHRLGTPRRPLVRALPVRATRSPRRPSVRHPVLLTPLPHPHTRPLRRLTAGTRCHLRRLLTLPLRHPTLPRLLRTRPHRRTTAQRRQLHTRQAVPHRPSTPRRLPTTARHRRHRLLTLLHRQRTRRLLPSTAVLEAAVHRPRHQATRRPLPCTARVATDTRLHLQHIAPRARNTRPTRLRTTLAQALERPQS